MSLKILKAEYYDGEGHEFYIPGSDLVSYLDRLTQGDGDGKYAGRSREAPITGMKTRTDWVNAINSVRATPRQWFKFAGLYVVKEKESYYMNADGIVTPGVRERGGPSYNELTGLLQGMGITDQKIAEGMRSLLANAIPRLGERYAPMAALLAAMFLAEPKRNPRSFPVNLMLLDFLQNGVRYGGRNDKEFSWDKILWRTGFGPDRATAVKSYTYSDGEIDHQAHERGGKLPMSHTGAVEQSGGQIPGHPPADSPVLFPNAEMEKECTIVIRWLQNILNATNKTFKQTGIARAGVGATLIERMRTAGVDTVTYAATFEGLKSPPPGGCDYLNINGRPYSNNTYEKLLTDQIKSFLNWRVQNLGNAKQN